MCEETHLDSSSRLLRTRGESEEQILEKGGRAQENELESDSDHEHQSGQELARGHPGLEGEAE